VQIVELILDLYTLESTAPGVHAGSGRPPWLRQPEVFVRRGGAHVLDETVGVGAAGVDAGTGVRVVSAELAPPAVGGPLEVTADC